MFSNEHFSCQNRKDKLIQILSQTARFIASGDFPVVRVEECFMKKFSGRRNGWEAAINLAGYFSMP